MADVAKLTLDKKIYDKVHDWEKSSDPLAPLSIQQRNFILDLSDELHHSSFSTYKVPLLKETVSLPDQAISKETSVLQQIQTSFQWYADLEKKWAENDDDVYNNYLQQLSQDREQCSNLLSQVESALGHLNHLSKEYKQVSMKTNSLHLVSEQLLADQTKLVEINEGVLERLKQFKSLDLLAQRLDSPTLSVTSPVFCHLLDQIDQFIAYMQTHHTYKECSIYLARYQHCLTRAISLLRAFVQNVLTNATQQTQACPASDASHYAKFQASAQKVKPVLNLVEQRRNVFPEYESLLAEFHQCYLDQRQQLIGPSVEQNIAELAADRNNDYCSFTRSACAFLIHVSHDELRLFHQFFTQSSPLFTKYLESICMSLYDKLRPMVIHMKHLETLAELCSILHVEMLQEHVHNSPAALEAFGSVAEQLLQDVQERLVFRTHLYLKTDIAQYKPSPGDLAYPEKLEMMEKIAQSLHEQEVAALARSESRSSLVSIGSSTSQEVARINMQQRALSTSSPGDLHGMWYPPVRRTLVCLSRLYRCVERPIFQGLSQEALAMCIQSINEAAQAISAAKSPFGVQNGELFQIKHLLILREQIAPFQVDFTVKEMSLDFSKMKTAAFDLLQKRSRLFSSDALLQFLLEGSPLVREHCLDSRKDVDRNLKNSCEAFIAHATQSIVGPLTSFLEKAAEYNGNDMRSQKWGEVATVEALIKAVSRNIKTELPSIQRLMQLYLANRDTEFIIYRPIKNNIIGTLSRLQQILNGNGYTEEDRIRIACPTPEQVTVLLSSTSLLANQKSNINSSSDKSNQSQLQPQLEEQPDESHLIEKTLPSQVQVMPQSQECG
ncbi:conserved oligomeric Golgi complex subunit 3 isoform X2 [Lycorma delicatula]|uniref:conserved oligomeric Golgi complex subunit 3 isoform X2 n=1 Tax=Lycorma delicatula TaxID=130591 RepID=UPI003F5177E3